MRKYLFSSIIVLLLVCPTVSQGQTGGPVAPSKRATAKKRAPARSKPEQEGASQPRRLWFTFSLSSVFDSNIEEESRGVRSFGLVPSAGLHFQDNPEKPTFEADYEVALHRYTHSDKYDRVSQNLTASYRRQLTRRWQARTTGELSLKGSSEDHDVNDQYVLEQQLHYRFNPANRLRLFAAYRLKRYPLEDVGKSAVDPYFGARFDQKLGGGRTWELLYRYDKNRSQDPKDRYVRRTYDAQFTTPLVKEHHDLLTLDLRYAPRLYARQIKVDGARVPRRDQRWTFDVLYERPLTEKVQLGLNYRYETRHSNDLDKNFNSHLLSVTFGYKWWR
ncbi:MAG TPA: hypothetical protein VEV81_15070 [Pyrinomonadaceae bacterium]|nr:hypothetical protein [Pyrinomonadaceae bacterium]